MVRSTVVALAVCCSAAAVQPGVYVKVQLHGVESSDTNLGELTALIAKRATLAPAQVTVVSATNVPPTAAQLEPEFCDRVSVTGLDATNHQAALMGHYTRRDTLTAGHAAWVKSDGTQFIYWNEKSDGTSMWVVGPNLGSDQAGMLIESQADVPQAALGQWYELGADDAWKAAATQMACDPVPTTALTVRVAPTACSGAGMAALKASVPDISTALHLNGFVIDLQAAGLQTTSLDFLGTSLKDCAPTISLSAPWAGKITQPLAVSKCHYDGQKIRIEHAAPDRTKPRHDSFACSHKHDKIEQKWKCECRTWKGDGSTAAADIGDNNKGELQ